MPAPASSLSIPPSLPPELDVEPVPIDGSDSPHCDHGGWIDGLLVAAGTAVGVVGWPSIVPCSVAFALIAVGACMPLLRVRARRRTRECSLLSLVPAEMADGYRSLRTAAGLPGVIGAEDLIEAADEMVIDVAAMLGGRQPRGAAQRRFVVARVRAMAQLETDMRERHEAWRDAVAEVERVDVAGARAGGLHEADRPATPGDDDDDHDDGDDRWLVRLFVVVLGPFFLVWDLLVALVDGVAALIDGVALRLRTVARCLWWAVRNVATIARKVIRRWVVLRARLVAAVRASRQRFSMGRARLHRRIRRIRRRVRSRVRSR